MLHHTSNRDSTWIPLALALVTLGCTPSVPAPDTGARAVLTLNAGWSASPWASPGGVPSPNGVMRLSTAFDLPQGRTGPGSALELEGLWWTAAVQLNGQDMGTVHGAVGPVQVPLGDALVPGRNTLSLTLRAPRRGTTGIATGAWYNARAHHDQSPDLLVAPRLLLRPAAHVSRAALPLAAGKVTPTATVTGAPEGATVRFLTTLDGDIIQDLGKATVGEGGVATGTPAPWSGPIWSSEDPALLQFTAVLEDAEGQVLDELSQRTGLRELVHHNGGTWLNRAPYPLVAGRLTHQPHLGSFAQRVSPWLAAGVNAVEIHGELVRQDWLDDADELGLPVVVLPRCVGRVRKAGPVLQDPTALKLQIKADEALVRSADRHPSVAVWVTEGDAPGVMSGPQKAGLPRLWTKALLSDPHQRPVVAHHMPGQVLRITDLGQGQHSCQGGRCRGSWLAEITWRPTPIANTWGRVATSWEDALRGGATGGTIPLPTDQELGTWTTAFKAVHERLQIPSWTAETRRAPAMVAITGGTPGQPVWLEVPSVGVEGAIVNSEGEATLESWYEGTAAVVHGDRRWAVDLEPGAWAGMKPTLDPAQVHLGGG